LHKGDKEMKKAENTILEVADLFLTDRKMTLTKLNYLCYYAQAYHLAFLDRPLFEEDFIAWVKGPTSKVLHDKYKKKYNWFKDIPVKDSIKNDFSQESMWVLEMVRDAYIDYSDYEIEALATHEDPWLITRSGLSRLETCEDSIKKEVIREYYIQYTERQLKCPNCGERVDGHLSGKNESGAIVNYCRECKTEFIRTSNGDNFIKI
jgi:uncharacterized phage-associated protein